MLLSVPLGKAFNTSTVPQPTQLSPVMPKLLVLILSAVKLDVRQVTLAPLAETSCRGPRTGGSACDKTRSGGSSSVVVPGPVAAVICCARSVSFWITMLAGGEGGAANRGLGGGGLGFGVGLTEEAEAKLG